MSKIPFFLLSIFIIFILTCYSQQFNSYRDPFEPVLPKEDEKEPEQPPPSDEPLPPALTVEGVLWGKNVIPMVVIDGKIYKIGDYVKFPDTQIITIEKNIVFIKHKGKIFEYKVKSYQKKGVE